MMFGVHRWKKRVAREGAQTEGQVCGLTAYGTPHGSVSDFGVKVRVRLPDGSTSEFEKGPLEARRVGQLFEGSVVPVRYDPANPERVVLDVAALEQQQAQVDAGRRVQLDAQFDHLGAAGAASAGVPGDLKTQLQQLAQDGGGVLDLRSTRLPDQKAPEPGGRVAKLAALKEQGLINDAQFETAKATILGKDGG